MCLMLLWVLGGEVGMGVASGDFKQVLLPTQRFLGLGQERFV